jgi:hypothetical protein
MNEYISGISNDVFLAEILPYMAYYRPILCILSKFWAKIRPYCNRALKPYTSISFGPIWWHEYAYIRYHIAEDFAPRVDFGHTLPPTSLTVTKRWLALNFGPPLHHRAPFILGGKGTQMGPKITLEWLRARKRYMGPKVTREEMIDVRFVKNMIQLPAFAAVMPDIIAEDLVHQWPEYPLHFAIKSSSAAMVSIVRRVSPKLTSADLLLAMARGSTMFASVYECICDGICDGICDTITNNIADIADNIKFNSLYDHTIPAIFGEDLEHVTAMLDVLEQFADSRPEGQRRGIVRHFMLWNELIRLLARNFYNGVNNDDIIAKINGIAIKYGLKNELIVGQLYRMINNHVRGPSRWNRK